MRYIILSLLTFVALCLSDWAYAQPPGAGRHHGGAPVVRGQAEPMPHRAPSFDPRHDFDRHPPRHPAPPPSYHHPARHPAPPPPPPPPREPRPKSFLQICLPFLSFGLSR
ncbi:MAG: hypothetical protein IJJ20_01040 [Thermoguttaceae bacterium]|nr:hypothetical protein [Thermoguttaceae bacterium]